MHRLFIDKLKSRLLRKLRTKDKPRLIFLVRIVLLVSRAFSDAYLLLGKQKGQGSILKVLIIGDKGTVSYLSSLLYCRQPHKIKLGKVFIYGIKLSLAAIVPKTDLVFIKTSLIGSRYWQKRGYSLIPEWVKFRLPIISEGIVRSYKDSLKDDIRRIKKYQYSFEINHSKEQFDFFYRMMYLPYISMRYPNTAYIQNYGDLKYFFSKGMILLVKDEEKYVSGCILSLEYDGLACRAAGVLGGNIEYVKAGAFASIYHFITIWAKEKGYKWVDFGGTRPFLEDGPFRYKRKWNMELGQQDSALNQYALKILNFNKNVKSFLVGNPFIYGDKESFKGIFFLDNEHPAGAEETERLYRRYMTPGIKKISAVSFSGFSDEAYKNAEVNNLKDLALLAVDFPEAIKLYAKN